MIAKLERTKNYLGQLIFIRLINRFIYKFKFEPWLKISNNVVCATSKGSDQPAPTRSLIRAFTSRLNILWLLSYWPNTIWSF